MKKFVSPSTKQAVLTNLHFRTFPSLDPDPLTQHHKKISREAWEVQNLSIKVLRLNSYAL